MPIPLIIAGVAIAASAYGGKKAYDGHKTKSEANNLLNSAKSKYNVRLEQYKPVEKNTEEVLSNLGQLELNIGEKLSEFDRIAKKLIEQLGANQSGFEAGAKIPKHSVKKIEEFSYQATQFLKDAATGIAGGAAASFAAYSGVMAFGAASTGTAISTLSGAAATNATLAALGGGSLATGGLGMAGGTAVLGGAALAPVLLVGGLAYNSHANKCLDKAKDASEESKKAIIKLDQAENYHIKLQKYISKVHNKIIELNEIFEPYFLTLVETNKTIINTSSKDREFTNDILMTISNGYMLAEVMVNIITTPLFKIKTSDDDEISFITDINGFNKINDDELEQVLA